jgi:molecular chaperone GrpE (heat shock protein)
MNANEKDAANPAESRSTEDRILELLQENEDLQEQLKNAIAERDAVRRRAASIFEPTPITKSELDAAEPLQPWFDNVLRELGGE